MLSLCIFFVFIDFQVIKDLLVFHRKLYFFCFGTLCFLIQIRGTFKGQVEISWSSIVLRQCGICFFLLISGQKRVVGFFQWSWHLCRNPVGLFSQCCLHWFAIRVVSLLINYSDKPICSNYHPLWKWFTLRSVIPRYVVTIFSYRLILDDNFVFSPRRFMFGLSGIPAFIQGVGMFFLPHSPRWLLLNGHDEKVTLDQFTMSVITACCCFFFTVICFMAHFSIPGMQNNSEAWFIKGSQWRTSKNQVRT